MQHTYTSVICNKIASLQNQKKLKVHNFFFNTTEKRTILGDCMVFEILYRHIKCHSNKTFQPPIITRRNLNRRYGSTLVTHIRNSLKKLFQSLYKPKVNVQFYLGFIRSSLTSKLF